MKKEISGSFSLYIQKYLNYRKSLGFNLKRTRYCLYGFSRYLIKNFPNAITVNRNMVVGYIKTKRHLHSKTRKTAICELRQFLRYLFQYNTDTYIPERAFVPQGDTKFKPHIYSKSQTIHLMKAASGLSPADSLRPHTYYTIIGLLWVSGLRIREIVNLDNEDVDLEKRLLYVKKTKFLKSRIVPVSKSTAAALKTYKKRKRSLGYSTACDLSFFVNERKKRCTTSTIQNTFHDLIKKLDLKTVQGGYPRLHDFRHSFATRWLSDIYRLKKDPNAYLPVVATYLGHANIANTQIYLHMSMDLLNNAGEKFRKHINSDHGRL